MKRRSGAVVRSLALATALLGLVVLPASRAGAQMFGMGFGYPGMGYAGMGYGFGGMGFGYPGMGFGYGGMGYGFGGMPYGGMGYGFGGLGAGYGGMGFGYPGYGYPGMGYSGMGYGYGALSYLPASTFSGAPNYNPMFGLGLTPLGTQSALIERNLLGRGTGRTYIRSYAPVRQAPPAAQAPTAR